MLNLLILLSVITYCYAAYHNKRRIMYFFKPCTMLLLIGLALSGLAQSPQRLYIAAITLGLLCSLAGDIFLMLPKERFAAGLGSFFLAHIFYLWALWQEGPLKLGPASWISAGALLIAGSLMLRAVGAGLTRLGETKLLLPIGLYILVLSLMTWRAASAAFSPGSGLKAGMLAIGAILFYLSDGILAWDRFLRPIPKGHLLVISLYFTAQYFFAASTGR